MNPEVVVAGAVLPNVKPELAGAVEVWAPNAKLVLAVEAAGAPKEKPVEALELGAPKPKPIKIKQN